MLDLFRGLCWSAPALGNVPSFFCTTANGVAGRFWRCVVTLLRFFCVLAAFFFDSPPPGVQGWPAGISCGEEVWARRPPCCTRHDIPTATFAGSSSTARSAASAASPEISSSKGRQAAVPEHGAPDAFCLYNTRDICIICLEHIHARSGVLIILGSWSPHLPQVARHGWRVIFYDATERRFRKLCSSIPVGGAHFTLTP